MSLSRAVKQVSFRDAVPCRAHVGLRDNHNADRLSPKENAQFGHGAFRAHSITEDEMVAADNLLYSAATAYKELQRYEYTFLLGHKGNCESLTIDFPSDTFHHLAGLHKIGYPRILKRKYALDHILDSSSALAKEDETRIESRLQGIVRLREMIESNALIVRTQHGYLKGSSIPASHIFENESYLAFVDGDRFISIFPPREDQIKNVRRCIRCTTLQITRSAKDGSGITVVYKNPAYKE